MMKSLLVAAIVSAASITTPATANLLTNGNFEASTSTTTTPPGWTNIGHTEGVLSYSLFGTPPYDGNYFYDLGGFGNVNGPVGDGIQQTVATTPGSLYTLTFGVTSENRAGTSVLDVFIGSLLTQYRLTADGTGDFQQPFTTRTISYLATSAFTTISFIESFNSSGGNNDPVIDGVSFVLTQGTVPEPASWAMMIAGIGVVGGAMRRRARRTAFA